MNKIESGDLKDLDCKCKDLQYLHERYETYVMEHDEKSGEIIEQLLTECKIQCPEHYILGKFWKDAEVDTRLTTDYDFTGGTITENWLNRLSLMMYEANYAPVSEYGGQPVTHSFFLYINPNREDEITKVPNFIEVKLYPKQSARILNEIGTIGSFRIILDENIKGIRIEMKDIK